MIVNNSSTGMNRYQIEDVIRRLAMSKGMYGRILNDIYSAPEDVQEMFWQNMEEQNFSSPLDVVMYFEC